MSEQTMQERLRNALAGVSLTQSDLRDLLERENKLVALPRYNVLTHGTYRSDAGGWVRWADLQAVLGKG